RRARPGGLQRLVAGLSVAFVARLPRAVRRVDGACLARGGRAISHRYGRSDWRGGVDTAKDQGAGSLELGRGDRAGNGPAVSKASPMMSTERNSPQSGFTLIETLAAMALMGLIISVLVAITSQWLPNWNR